MPVADFAGRFGWGYDGVDLYAPTRLYGTPDDLRAFVDRAHALGLGVILDVVYNHIGPDGNYLSDFARDYFTERYTNDWGEALNFETSPPARAFFVENAGYWIDEFHLDGLRLDATQDIHDISPRPRRLRTDPRGPREGRLSRHLRGRRERAAGDPSRSRSGAGRPRRRRALERRLSPHGGRRADRKAGSLLLRLQGLRAGVPVLREVRLSLSGAVVPLAEEAPRNAGPRPPAARLRQLPRESRSGGEYAVRQASPPGVLAVAAAGGDRADAARSGDADAFPGAGVRLVFTVPVFRGPQGGAARTGVRGTAGVPVAISERARTRTYKLHFRHR